MRQVVWFLHFLWDLSDEWCMSSFYKIAHAVSCAEWHRDLCGWLTIGSKVQCAGKLRGEGRGNYRGLWMDKDARGLFRGSWVAGR